MIDGTLYVFAIVICAALHEFAHIFAVFLTKAQIEKVHIMPFGVEIILINKNSLSYTQEIFVSIAGPAVNLVLFFAVIISEAVFGYNYILSFLAAGNFFLFLINMLPIMPLDGGRALYALLLLKKDIVKAAFLSDLISFITIIPVVILGFYFLALTGYNFSLIIISIYLIIIFITKNLKSGV